MPGSEPTNEEIAERLDEMAELLSSQEANPFRVAAYHKAADTLRHLESQITDLYQTGGIDALSELPSIGESLARLISEILETGGSRFLEQLRGRAGGEDLFATVPGVGKKLAAVIHERLGIETLEELEAAAHDGRLAEIPGFGPRRLRGIAEALAGRLGGRSRRRRWTGSELDVSELLDVDREYRQKAEKGSLKTIAPRRFNPEGRAWLPILHTERDHRHYTALFSNTARAHELDKTRDWVVIYQDDGRGERQATVVTETRGPMAGRRVVRGRERECLEHYRRETGASG